MKHMVYFVITWFNERTKDRHKYMCCFEENLDKVAMKKINNLRTNPLNHDIHYKFISYDEYLNGKAQDEAKIADDQAKSRAELQKDFAEHCKRELARLDEVKS